MEYKLKFADVVFHILSEREIELEPELQPFLAAETEPADLTVQVSWDWKHAKLPDSDRAGEDLLSYYYIEGAERFCVTRGGPKGAVACTRYHADFSEVVCTYNEKPFLMPPKTMGSLMRMLPMREIFQHFQTVFLHASQIALRGKGILFTAPSGTGKTTQAKLWEQYRSAEIICNDRTLTRKLDGLWHTYGYPIDGSEPVRSEKVNRLRCVVLLRQGLTNTIQPLPPARAVSLLMRQVVFDTWSGTARATAMQQLLSLVEDIPVLLLTCTPDERAVEMLEQKLKENED